MLAPPKQMGGIYQTCYMTSLLGMGVLHAISLTTAEFYQTCYMTSPHGKGVREQSYFSVYPSATLLATLAPSVGILRWHAID